MIYHSLLWASVTLIWAGCQSSLSPSKGFRQTELDEVRGDSDGGSFAGVDPIVAHFFNTASLANDDAAVLAATRDGGANADAGN